MKLIIGNWCFSPKILTSLLALIFFCLFVFLGFWQLDRAEYKSNLYTDFQSRQTSAAIDIGLEKNNSQDKKKLLWRNVEANGVFLEQYQILLDNQVNDTRAGYFIYTPFRLDQSNAVVLINRGWLIAGKDRKTSPEIVLSDGQVKITGVIKDIPKTGLLLKELPPEQMNETTYRVQQINLNELEKLTETELLPYIIRLEPESDRGYIRKWRQPGSDEAKHKGYAFQWFAFATVLVIIYLVLNVKRIQARTYE